MKRLLTFLLILLISGITVHAGTTGKIRGSITDAETGEPLIGANVIILGTSLGAATDLDGNFLILAVSPGEYKLRASMIGFETMIQIDVQVEVDRTIIVNFPLSQTELQSAEVVVTAARDKVRLDVSASETNLQATEINNLPFASRVENIIGMQAGVTGNLLEGEINIREGASVETNVLVDGYSTADTKAGKVSFPVNKNSIQEIKVMRGGYNAEYGEARSGIVNIITKTPEDKIHVSVDYQFEPASYRHDGADRYDPSKMWQYRLFDGANSNDSSFIVRYEGIAPDTAKFEGWNSYSERLLSDNNLDNDLTAEEARELWRWRHRPIEYGNQAGHNLDLSLSGGVDFVPWDLNVLGGFKYINRPYTYPQPRDQYEEIGYMFKMINRFGNNTTLTFTALNTTTNTVSSDDANSKWSNEVKISYDGGKAEPFYLAKKPYVNNVVDLYGLHLMHIFKPTLYLEVDANFYKSTWDSDKFPEAQAEDGRYFGNERAKDDEGNFIIDEDSNFVYIPRLFYDPQSGHIPVEFGDTDDVSGFSMYGRANSVDKSFTERIDVKVALVNQFHPMHELKIGVQYRTTNIVQDRIHIHDDDVAQTFINRSDVTPYQFNAYVQDKIEFGGMVANLGVRLDYYNPNGTFPNVQRVLEMGTNLEVVNTFMNYTDSLKGAFPYFVPEASMYFSPRIGLAFPITTNSKVYFNYGHFVQMPQPEAMYFSQAAIGNRLQWLGDASLTFQKSINYELGYDQNVYDLFQLHVGAYFKDYSGRESGIVYAHSDQSLVLESAVQRENMEIRGLDIEFRKSSGRWVTGFFNFNISQKSVSDLSVPPDVSQIPIITDNPAIGVNGELKGVPRPVISEITPYGRGVVTIRTPENWGPMISDYPIFHKTGFSFGLFYRGAQLTNHPDKKFRADNPDVKFYLIPYFSSNLRITRNFQLSNSSDIEIYLDVSNLWVSKYRVAIPDSRAYYNDLFANGKTDRVGSEDVSNPNILRTESDVLYAGQHRTFILGFRFNL